MLTFTLLPFASVSYEDQFNNLFFARVDTYARNPQSAPQAGLTLDGSADQNLMRLACASV